MMHERAIRHLPLIDDSRTLLGLLTEKQVLAASDEAACASIMTADPITVGGDTSLFAALRLSCELRLSALPVVSAARRLDGIITRGDLLAASYRLLGLDRPGVCLEFALVEHVEDAMTAFDAMRRCGVAPLSAVVGSVRDDGDEPAIYIRLPKEMAREAEKAMVDAGLIALVPENQEPHRRSNGDAPRADAPLPPPWVMPTRDISSNDARPNP